jgi:hypothetical protein
VKVERYWRDGPSPTVAGLRQRKHLPLVWSCRQSLKAQKQAHALNAKGRLAPAPNSVCRIDAGCPAFVQKR